MNIAPAYGGSGQEQWAWALLRRAVDPLRPAQAWPGGRLPTCVTAVAHLAGLAPRDNGWPCALAPGPIWRGPGRKEDPCPYATLVMLKVVAGWETTRDGPEARAGAEALLTLWAESRERHPYMFYMGTDFRKLKVPYVWYDLMHVVEVLTQFPWLRGDPRLCEMPALAQQGRRGWPPHARVGVDAGALGVWPEKGPLALADVAGPSDLAALSRRSPAFYPLEIVHDNHRPLRAYQPYRPRLARAGAASTRRSSAACPCRRSATCRAPPWTPAPASPGAHLRGAHLRLAGPRCDEPTLEIFTYDDILVGPATAVNRTGFAHIAFSVEDVVACGRQSCPKEASRSEKW